MKSSGKENETVTRQTREVGERERDGQRCNSTKSFEDLAEMISRDE